MLLELHEKKRFEEWLRVEIYGRENIVDQLSKLGGAVALISDREKTQCDACKVVLDMLTRSESVDG